MVFEKRNNVYVARSEVNSATLTFETVLSVYCAISASWIAGTVDLSIH